MKWKGLDNYAYQIEANAKIHQIANYLSNLDLKNSRPDIGLMGGLVGVAIFHYFYAIVYKRESHLQLVNDIIEYVIDTIEDKIEDLSFGNGLAGILWAISFLNEKKCTMVSEEQIIKLDQVIQKSSFADLDNMNYDLFSGAIGKALYLFSRKSFKIKKEYIQVFIDKLKSFSSAPNSNTLAWESVIDMEGNKEISISLSHGMSSLVILLSKFLFISNNSQVELILNSSIQYILDQEINSTKNISLFPNLNKDIRLGELNSRLAWCYGDLGIAYSLLFAANTLSNEGLRNKAINILLHSSRRRNLKDNMVIDASLCHGSSGIAHIFHKTFNITGKEPLLETAIYWYNVALSQATFKDGIAGYKTWYTDMHGGWQNQIGLLEGVSGIGLSLLSSISNINPEWDEVLLL